MTNSLATALTAPRQSPSTKHLAPSPITPHAAHPPPPRGPLVGLLIGLLIAVCVLLTTVLGLNQGTAVGSQQSMTAGATTDDPGQRGPTHELDPQATHSPPATLGLAGALGLPRDPHSAGDPNSTNHPSAASHPSATGDPGALGGPDTPRALSAQAGGDALGGLSALGTVERFHWPLAPPHPVLRPFQPPSTPYGPGHRGVDLGGQLGEPVLAAGSGLVLYAGPLADRSLVSIEHVGGLRTTYEPVRPTVQVGQYVRRGQVIGVLMAGHPGCPATAPTVCLHWGVHRERVYLDPLRLVESGRIRLLPWPTGVP